MNTNRPPIVVILGHVDHGKTTLLDYLRKSNIASREAGGITQHIRSFQYISTDGKKITFIDTPGHAAFAQMRSRGSRVADIAILVVAADDGVMPQTKQSIEFIKAAGIPFVVAINKVDLPTSNPDKVKTQLTENEVVVEDFGGDVPAIGVSAKTGAGIPDLVEMVHLISDLTPPQADPEATLDALVLESRLDPQKGPLATVIVKNGTLQVGQNLFQQKEIGKVRALLDPDGTQTKFAPPSSPVEILGLSMVPEVGTSISTQPIAPASIKAPTAKSSEPSKINLIIKADVAGSQEAILNSLDPQATIITSATGDVSESDVMLARTSNAQILAFNVKIPSGVAKLAEVDKIRIRHYKIIYELLEDMDKIVNPASTETILGEATVQAEFKINADRIAGCKCTSGQISKSDQIRLIRNGQPVGLTRIKSLQLGKTTSDKVKAGQEFGAVFSPYLDFRPGDNIIALTTHGTS